MAGEVTPNKENPIIELSNEPIRAPEAILEPQTAKIRELLNKARNAIQIRKRKNAFSFFVIIKMI